MAHYCHNVLYSTVQYSIVDACRAYLVLQQANDVGHSALLADVVLVAGVERQIGEAPHHLQHERGQAHQWAGTRRSAGLSGRKPEGWRQTGMDGMYGICGPGNPLHSPANFGKGAARESFVEWSTRECICRAV